MVKTAIWAFITYGAFFTESGKELGIVGWSILSFVLLILMMMFWLMGTRKLPAYVIVEKEGTY
jgi:hypothetical protein